MSESQQVSLVVLIALVVFGFLLWFAISTADVSTWTPAGNGCYAHHFENNHAFSPDHITNNLYCRR